MGTIDFFFLSALGNGNIKRKFNIAIAIANTIGYYELGPGRVPSSKKYVANGVS